MAGGGSNSTWLRVGVLALAGIAVGLGIGLVSGHSARTPESLVADPPAARRPIVLRPSSEPSPASERAVLALGAELYARDCAACHGARGEGEPSWQLTRPDGSLPAPPHDGTGHSWHHPDDELLRITAEGGRIYSPSSNMPGFADRLSEAEMRAILAHIKTLWGPEERAFQAERNREAVMLRAGLSPMPRATPP